MPRLQVRHLVLAIRAARGPQQPRPRPLNAFLRPTNTTLGFRAPPVLSKFRVTFPVTLYYYATLTVA